MTTPIISIGFPVYNVEKYVEASLLSILNQTISIPYEVLVIDDCGSDSSMDIISSIQRQHPRGSYIKIIKHPRNLGLGAASNTALGSAVGKYLYYLDSDDMMTEGCLEKLYAKAEATDADVTFGSFDMINSATHQKFGGRHYQEEFVQHEHVGFYLDSQDRIPHWERWNKLYRVDFLRKNNIRTISRVMEDMYFEFRCNCCAKSYAFIPDVTMVYNFREESIMSAIKEAISDEWGIASVAIIKQEQKDIINEFSDVPRVYKIYYDRVLACCRHFSNSPYTKEQLDRFIPQIKGFNRFIPHVYFLKQPMAWINYLVACIHEDYRLYAALPSLPERIVSGMKKYTGARFIYHKLKSLR